jgi:hypothetical protein
MAFLRFFSFNKILLLAVVAGGVWWMLPSWKPDQFGLPVHMKLVNKENRSIKVVVTERSSEHIRLVRVDTNQRFTYNLSDLRLDSRLRLLRYPATIEAPAASRDLRAMHREGLIQERQRLQNRLAELSSATAGEIQGDGQGIVSVSVTNRGKIREMERIQQRIQDLNSRIAVFSD